MSYLTRLNFQIHPFNLVSPSPWPINTSISLINLIFYFVLILMKFINIDSFFFLGHILLVSSMLFWFRDVVAEGTYLGGNTQAVIRGLTYGMFLFILSEAIFFASFFWAFFHSSLAPGIEIGGSWPPAGIEPINPFELPLLNTVILLSSGATITYAHHSLISGQRKGALYGSLFTAILAVVFTCFQGVEYNVSSFTISDSVFGSCFYLLTGFHGLHVIIGSLFLGIGLWRIYVYHLTETRHLGFENSILYWHFVDLIWIILYVVLYYWGS